MGTTANVDHWQEILGLLMFQNGAKLENPTGPLAEGALDFYTAFTKIDKVWNDSLPNSTTMFASGKLAMMLAPSWRAHDIIAENPTLKFRVLSVPQLPKNTPDEPDITYATYWVNAVSGKSTKQAAAWDFLKFLSTKESYQKLYDNAVKLRTFGEPFPRIDMRDAITSDPKVGGFISLAGNAKSWYLNGRTFDGETGINSRIGKYFEDAVNAVSSGAGNADSKAALKTASAGVLQVLVDYGLAQAPAPVK
jgi:ABC-type glycerol-3-phosphate transport system substrate-binding protein